MWLQRDSRYDGQIAVFGADFQQKLADTCYFLVSYSLILEPMTDAPETHTRNSHEKLARNRTRSIWCEKLTREISCCKSVWHTYKFLAWVNSFLVRVSRTCVMGFTQLTDHLSSFSYVLCCLSPPCLLIVVLETSVFFSCLLICSFVSATNVFMLLCSVRAIFPTFSLSWSSRFTGVHDLMFFNEDHSL